MGPIELPEDHPGFGDPVYRARRAEIAEASAAWTPGTPLPVIDYTAEEHAVWATVLRELTPLHRRFAAPAFQDGAEALGLAPDRIPQLHEVAAGLERQAGMTLQPVPGLVPARRFYGSLADSVFLSTQYLRHPSTPLYTPEPDVVHEVVGHGNLLANPVFAELHRAAGRCSRRCETEAAHEFFSRVFWFTLEFGVVVGEGHEPLAYGAGLASSFGEITVFREAEIRPFDLVAMGTLDYDITHYQPVLFSVSGVAELEDRLGSFFDTFDDDAHRRLLGRSQAA